MMQRLHKAWRWIDWVMAGKGGITLKLTFFLREYIKLTRGAI